MTVGDIEQLVQDEPNVEGIEESHEQDVEDNHQKPVFNKRQVSDVVRRERERAYEKGRKDAMMQMQQEQQVATNQAATEQQPNNANMMHAGIPALTEEDIARIVDARAPQALQSQFQQLKQDHLVNTFVNKMQAAEQKYPGLEQELSNLNYGDTRMHAFLEMANAMDNTGDIMKEVIDNPTKLEDLLSLAEKQPYLAQKAMQRLSESIKQNESAKYQEAQAKDPMSQIRPSPTAGMDSGEMSIKDFKKMFRV